MHRNSTGNHHPANGISGGAVATSSTCGNANGSVDLSVSGGTPAYTYAWSNGATTRSCQCAC
ncbi:MAG: SprB repeat-containing protein [Bacteroidales bacterium]|nr:SprB repeat-containing protein [Bacteroidales bacterium]